MAPARLLPFTVNVYGEPQRTALYRFPRATHIPKGSGHSRTLYTSNALDQRNFIF